MIVNHVICARPQCLRKLFRADLAACRLQRRRTDRPRAIAPHSTDPRRL